MYKFKINKKKSAQQLIEFLLVVPLIIIFLGILTEYAYALNIDMTLTNGLKSATSNIYRSIEPGMSSNAIQAIVRNELVDYLQDNNVPVTAENNLIVTYSPTGDPRVFTALYQYLPAFELPHWQFRFLPERFLFAATSAVPESFLLDNDYNSGATISSTDLDDVWNPAGFNNLTDFDGSKRGILGDNNPATGRANMLFLIPDNASADLIGVPHGHAYALVNWNGQIMTDSGSDVVVNTDNGDFYWCSPTVCTTSGLPLIQYMIWKQLYYTIFIHDVDASDPRVITNWSTPLGLNADLTNGSGVLRRAMTFSAGPGFNYDGLTVNSYNSTIPALNPYTVTTFGSFVFVTQGDNIGNIATGSIPPASITAE